MEKVIITKCEVVFGGKAHGCTFADGRQATAWNDKVDGGVLMQAFSSGETIEVELKPYNSKGKQGFNIIEVRSPTTAITSESPVLDKGDQVQKLVDATFGSDREKSIVAQCLCKAKFRNTASPTSGVVMDAYKYFLEKQ